MSELLTELHKYERAAIAQRRSAERQACETNIPPVKSEYYQTARYWQGVADGYVGAAGIVFDFQPLVGSGN